MPTTTQLHQRRQPIDPQLHRMRDYSTTPKSPNNISDNSSRSSGSSSINSNHRRHYRHNDKSTSSTMIDWEKAISSIDSQTRLTYRDVERAGPPSRPLEFPAPTVSRATRISNDVYDPRTDSYSLAKNVIFCRPPCSNAGDDAAALFQQNAYWIRGKIKESVYGSVRLCSVLKRRRIPKWSEPDCFAGPGWSIRGGAPYSGQDEYNSRGYRDRGGGVYGGATRQCPLEEDEWRWEMTGEFVAVKLVEWAKVRRMRGKHLEDPVKEVACMQLLGDYNPHIIGIVDALQDDHYLYVFTPYCSGGDLYGMTIDTFKCNDTGRLTETQARHWFRQMLLGLHHLQIKGVCHRDLSLENILIHKNTLKIIDMGMCLRVPFSDPDNEGNVTDVSANTVRRLIQAQGQGGKILYMAPEVIAREPHFDGFATDLWSVSVMLYTMLVGFAPFKWAHESDQCFRRIINGKLAETLEYWNIPLSQEACDLLQNMLHRHPRKRLTLAQVMNHPWVTQNDIGQPVSPQEEKTHAPKSTNAIGWRRRNRFGSDGDQSVTSCISTKSYHSTKSNHSSKSNNSSKSNHSSKNNHSSKSNRSSKSNLSTKSNHSTNKPTRSISRLESDRSVVSTKSTVSTMSTFSWKSTASSKSVDSLTKTETWRRKLPSLGLKKKAEF